MVVYRCCVLLACRWCVLVVARNALLFACFVVDRFVLCVYGCCRVLACLSLCCVFAILDYLLFVRCWVLLCVCALLWYAFVDGAVCCCWLVLSVVYICCVIDYVCCCLLGLFRGVWLLCVL